MRHGGYLLLRAGGEGYGGTLACEKTGRRRPDAASCAGYERDAASVYPAFGHSLLSAEKYVLAATDPIFHPRALSSFLSSLPHPATSDRGRRREVSSRAGAR